MSRVVVVGDVGGHPQPLRAALTGLGAGDDGRDLPLDVTVVQVGDLVDRGPDSTEVLKLVGWYLQHRPQQWIQLVGNHESQYLSGGSFFWPERLPDADADLLRAWWKDGSLQVAAAVRTDQADELLISHAGLTVGAWQQLGEPMSAAAAAQLLNQRPEPLIWHGGDLARAPAVDPAAGPLWADAGWELYEPWLSHHAHGGFVPFGQVHGHSQIVNFDAREWRCPGRVRQRTTVDWHARHVQVRIGGRRFTGVDPKHGRHGAVAWAPLVLDDANLLTSAIR